MRASVVFILAGTLCAGDAWPDNLDNERFNAGILSLEPAMNDFVEMIASYRNHTNYQYEGQAEQARLPDVVRVWSDTACHTKGVLLSVGESYVKASIDQCRYL